MLDTVSQFLMDGVSSEAQWWSERDSAHLEPFFNPREDALAAV